MPLCIIVGTGSGLSKSIAKKYFLYVERQASRWQGDASDNKDLERVILELERYNWKCKTLIYASAVLVSEKTTVIESKNINL